MKTLAQMLAKAGLIIAVTCFTGCTAGPQATHHEAGSGKGGFRITDGIRGNTERVFYSRAYVIKFTGPNTPSEGAVLAVALDNKEALRYGFDHITIDSDENTFYLPGMLGKEIDKATLLFVPQGGSKQVVLAGGLKTERKFRIIGLPESQYLNEVSAWNQRLEGKDPSLGAAPPNAN